MYFYYAGIVITDTTDNSAHLSSDLLEVSMLFVDTILLSHCDHCLGMKHAYSNTIFTVERAHWYLVLFIYGDTYCSTRMHIYIYHFSLHASHSETRGSCRGIQADCCVMRCILDECRSKEGTASPLSDTLKWCDAGGLSYAYLALWRFHALTLFLWVFFSFF